MDEKKKNGSDSAPTEKELLRGRRFDPAEAIGRDNAELLRGASPVARARQAALEIEHHLKTHLADPDGSLLRTMVAALTANEPLLSRHYDRPLQALTEFVDGLLGNGQRLASLVRDADARWGRDYQERPRFERDGQPPAADDPYTRDSVRDALEELRRGLGPRDR